MGKEVKTNAMRMLDRQKIPYELMNYEWGKVKSKCEKKLNKFY